MFEWISRNIRKFGITGGNIHLIWSLRAVFVIKWSNCLLNITWKSSQQQKGLEEKMNIIVALCSFVSLVRVSAGKQDQKTDIFESLKVLMILTKENYVFEISQLNDSHH